MMHRNIFLITLIATTLYLHSCKQEMTQEDVIDEDVVLTKDIQAHLTPDYILHTLKKRNSDYSEGKLTIVNTPERIQQTALAQYPAAVVLSCIDSRVPVEDIFHSGIGDLFVIRVAGNICNEDILGSLEYACKVSGVPLIVVLGHEHCGAIKSALQKVELGNITTLLAKIKPAILDVEPFTGEKNEKNPDYMKAVSRANIRHTIEDIRKNSPLLKEMEDSKKIKIVGAEYLMDTGKVDFFDS